MKKSLPLDGSFNFAWSPFNRLVQLNPHHGSILSQIPTLAILLLLFYFADGARYFLLLRCSLITPNRSYTRNEFLPKRLSKTLSPHRRPGQGGTALPCHLQPGLGSQAPRQLPKPPLPRHQPAQTVRKRELQLQGKGGYCREAAQFLHRRVTPY